MCSTVSGTPHVSHVTRSPLKRPSWVRRVCPMRRRVSARCSSWLSRSVPGRVFGLTRRRKRSRSPCHSLSHARRMRFLAHNRKSWAGTGRLMRSSRLADLAVSSARSFPIMPQWPGTQHNMAPVRLISLSMACTHLPVKKNPREIRETRGPPNHKSLEEWNREHPRAPGLPLEEDAKKGFNPLFPGKKLGDGPVGPALEVLLRQQAAVTSIGNFYDDQYGHRAQRNEHHHKT